MDGTARKGDDDARGRATRTGGDQSCLMLGLQLHDAAAASCVAAAFRHPSGTVRPMPTVMRWSLDGQRFIPDLTLPPSKLKNTGR